MKQTSTKTHPSPQGHLSSRLFSLLAILLSFATAWEASAQTGTYTLSNAWTVAAGTFNLTGGSDAGNRGLAYSSVSNTVFVPYRAGSANYGIYAFDGTSGALLGTTNGALGSRGLNCDQVGVGDDGTLYGCPLNTGVSAASPFKVYSWTNWANNSNYLCYSSSNTTDPVILNLAGKRIGDTMCVTGSGTNTLILATAGGLNSWVLLSTTDGINFTSTVLTNTSSIVTAGQNVFGLCFFTNNTFMVLPANKTTAYLVQFPTNFASLPSPVNTTLLGTVPVSSAGSTALISASPGGQLLAVMTNSSTKPTGVFLDSGTNILSTVPNLAATTFASPNVNGNGTGGIALGGAGKTNYLYVMDTDNGLLAYKISYTTAPVAPSISSQPSGVASPAYAPQTLSVGATGTAPLSYQWKVNSTNSTVGATPITNATNASLTLTSAVTNYYFVVVTNIAGSATSSVVQVTTIPATTNSVVTPIVSIAIGNTNFPWLANDDNTRGLAYDPTSSRLVVANKTGGAHLYLIDANTGAPLGSLNTSGMYVGGTFPVDQVVVAADGVVYAGNLALANQPFNITSWSSANTNAAAYAAYPQNDPGSGSGDRWGDTMTVRGSGVNTQILLGSRGTNVALLTTGNGTDFTATLIPVPGVPAAFAGLGIAFGASNTFWAKNYNGDLYQVSFDPTGSTPAAVVLDYIHAAQFPNANVGLGVDATHNILGSVNLTDHNPDLQLYQLTGSSNAPVMFDQVFFANYNPSANGNDLGVVDMKYPRVYAMDVDIGIVGVTYDVPASTPPAITTLPTGGTVYASSVPFTLGVGVSGTLPLYYKWQKNSVSNLATATNIPGAIGASYTLSAPKVSDSGWYNVIITNFGGAATSSPVQLTVIAPVTNVVVTNLWTVPAGSRGYLDASSYAARGLAYDTNTATVLVSDRVHTTINVLNAADGSDSSITINTAGLPNGTFVLNQIGVADDGALYGANLVVPGDGNTFNITRWSAVSSGAGENAAFAGDPGAGSGDRWGDTMAVRGSGVNTQILLGSYGNGSGPGTNVALLTTTDGSTFTLTPIPVSGVPSGFAGLGLAFGAGNTFWAKGGNGYNLRQVAFDPTGATPASVLQSYTAGTQIPNTFTGLGVDAANNLLFGTCFNDVPNDFQMYLLTGNTNAPILENQSFYGSYNANAQFNAAAAVKFPYAFGLDVNNGLVALTYGVPAAPLVSFPISTAYSTSGFVLTWPTVAGHSYQLQSRPALASGSWSNVGSPMTAGGSSLSYTNSTHTGSALFYRVVGQ